MTSYTNHLYQNIIDRKDSYRLKLAHDTYENVRAEVLRESREVKVWSSSIIKTLNTYAEQLMEAAILKERFSFPSVARAQADWPVAIMVIEDDSMTSLHVRIYCPAKPVFSQRYSVTYNSAPYEETRNEFLQQMQNKRDEANRNPYKFFA